jgi:hypothetical protein
LPDQKRGQTMKVQERGWRMKRVLIDLLAMTVKTI